MRDILIQPEQVFNLPHRPKPEIANPPPTKELNPSFPRLRVAAPEN
jgi:hypothetical protein